MPKTLLILGGGIAGASLAYLAARAGLTVTVLDAGLERASSVPSALINPVRGQGGQVVEGGTLGMRFTWKVLEQLLGQGHAVPHARSGVLRPVPDEKTFEKWRGRIPEELPHRWLERADLMEQNLSAQHFRVLEVPEGGWLDGVAFVGALLEASGARRLRGRAVRWDATSATLENGETLEADAVVYCGGSAGFEGFLARASVNPVSTPHSPVLSPHPHRRGSLLLLERPLSPLPVSFGIYGSPSGAGGVLGATYETPTQTHAGGSLPLGSLEWLTRKAAQTFDSLEGELRGVWTATRLGGDPIVGRQPDGSHALTALGSKGFLLGPLLARAVLGQVLEG